MEIIYNKLVRDKIPEIIESNNKKFQIQQVDQEEYCKLLDQKLMEEVNEYLESGNVEELADLLEVIYAIAETKEISLEELEIIRKGKLFERGGFTKRIKLIRVYEE
ncbi:conserved hypothetical protein [Alkaliphilus metalliredigens QYMF]|uniref:Phosphoribosyl-ATP pyrophosphohydrolase n=1 Tax=Alkaliphilus metalliredigens (strain QYMF) TaxID=293826 RepID=A6TNW1_ALKMQ|nr:nucleoside triphosphate pyrophosphohydrolase [Alkaliphilus metalliredigens]ABR47879.1 conserved hypothetical protein [Alkaliphilus metalliredigens QYMF]